jgi:hypothetical protein
MYEASRHLHYFYVKCGICQLTDHEYDMSMPIFYNYLVIDHEYDMSMPIFCNYLVIVLLINC